MFVFDNLIMSDDRSLQTLLRAVDTELLVLALKGQMSRSVKSCLDVCPSGRLQISWMKWKPLARFTDRSAGRTKRNHQCGP